MDVRKVAHCEKCGGEEFCVICYVGYGWRCCCTCCGKRSAWPPEDWGDARAEGRAVEGTKDVAPNVVSSAKGKARVK